jgi:nicotinate phosphoribosyltransferase
LRKKNDTCAFNYFFRVNPFKGGFTVFAGLSDFLKLLTKFTFSDSDIQFLSQQGFQKEFLEYLKTFRFSGTILSVKEGEIVFPNEPVMQVEGSIIECQLIESMLLNIINFRIVNCYQSFPYKEGMRR